LVGALAVVTIAACTTGSDERGVSGGDSASGSPPLATAADSAAPLGSPSASAWTVTPSGIGRVRVGMTVDELRLVAGDIATPAGGVPACAYVRPASVPRGVAVMLAGGRVARVDVDSAGVRSDAGVAVGDTSASVMQAYAARVTTMPHKYVRGGEYLIVRPSSPSDSTLRIVFESEAGRITRYRSGRVPEVEWVERCG
jgi:hypothetical protein